MTSYLNVAGNGDLFPKRAMIQSQQHRPSFLAARRSISPGIVI